MTISAEDHEQVVDIANLAGAAGGKAAVFELLPLYGINVNDPAEMQELMVHMRFWTELWKFTATKIISAFVFMCVGGALAVGIMMRLHSG